MQLRRRAAIAGIESGGRYDALGVVTKGDRPYGKYQIMGNNIAQWTKDATGKAYTRAEFLANPAVQDATFDHRFGNYVRKYGEEAAARAWIGGEGAVHGDQSIPDKLGTRRGDYGRDYMQRLTGKPQPRVSSPQMAVDAAPNSGVSYDPENPRGFVEQAVAGAGLSGGKSGGTSAGQPDPWQQWLSNMGGGMSEESAPPPLPDATPIVDATRHQRFQAVIQQVLGGDTSSLRQMADADKLDLLASMAVGTATPFNTKKG